MTEENNKKGLGRGLMSLFGDESDKMPTKTETNNPYLSLSISDLEPNKFQPRKYFDEKRIDELSQSIKKKWINSTNSS
jgi:ParB family chromosome partitioning protein